MFDLRRCLLALTIAGPLFTSHLSADDAPPFYEPVERQVEGWKVAVDPRLLSAEQQEFGGKALEALANHLQRVKYILSEERVVELQRLRIWIELDNAKLANMQYHPDRGWLLAHDHDPRLVKHVHIPRAADLLDRHTWAKHPYVVLHELAHAYHDQVLGFDEPRIRAAFESAKERKIYDEVLLITGAKVRHYALTNHKEYFAESTEAYLGVNDFYPFVRAELKGHDPEMFLLLESIWGVVK
ncbi:MAG: metallopeptidase [Pirellulaceae bacterium]